MEENLFQCNEVRDEYKDILQTIYKLTIKWRKKQIIGKKERLKREIKQNKNGKFPGTGSPS